MTLDQFFEKLEQTPRDWYGSYSAIRRTDSNGWCGQCPVSSLGGLPIGFAWTVAIDLGMDSADVERVIHAADNVIGCDQDIRARLLKACGL